MESKTMILKLHLAGESSIGKTSLLVRAVQDKFDYPYQVATIGLDFYIKHYEFNTQRVKVQYWDIVGSERYRVRNPSFKSNPYFTQARRQSCFASHSMSPLASSAFPLISKKSESLIQIAPFTWWDASATSNKPSSRKVYSNLLKNKVLYILSVRQRKTSESGIILTESYKLLSMKLQMTLIRWPR
jgi:GTPase SAR1 family protein